MAIFTLKASTPANTNISEQPCIHFLKRNFMRKTLRNLALLFVAVVLSFNGAMAATYYFFQTTNQDFATPTNWYIATGGGGTQETSTTIFATGNTFNIPSGQTVNLLSASETVGPIVVAGTLTIPASNAFTLTSHTTIANTGTINVTGGTLVSTTTTTSSGTFNVNGGVFTSTTGLTVSGGTMTISSGTATASTTMSITGGTVTSSGGNLNVTGGNTTGITISSGATLVISGGTVTEGTAANAYTTFTDNGTLTVSSGTLNVYGNMVLAATFNQSGGNIYEYGMGSTSSVASGTDLVAVTSATGTVNGGTLTIVDPPSTGTAHALGYNVGTSASWVGHTLQLGGTSSFNSTSTYGFLVDCYVGSAYLTLGNVIANGGAGTGTLTDRFVSGASSADGTYIGGNLTINASSEFRDYSASGAVIYVGGSITNNGTLTIQNTLELAAWSAGTASASTVNQVISGTGVFRNNTTNGSSTANFTNLIINNSNATGVTFSTAGSLVYNTTPVLNTGTVSGTFTWTAGIVNTGGNPFVLGTAIGNLGTYTYTAGGFSTGSKFGRWYASSTTGGSTITASTVPSLTANNAGSYPFVVGSNTRAFSFKRTSTAACTGGIIYVQYNDGSGFTTVSVADASPSYTITQQTVADWVVTTSSFVAGTGESETLAISGQGLFNTTNAAAPRVMTNGAVVGTYQGGTVLPEGERINVTTPANTYYLGINASDIVPTAVASGDWNNPATWGGTVPTACNQVIIPAGITVSVDNTYNTNAAVCAGLTVQSTGVLNITANSLTVACSTGPNTISNAGTISLSGGALNVTQYTAAAGVTNTGTFTVSGGAFTMGAAGKNNTTFANNSGGSLTVSSGSMYVYGNINLASGSSFTQSGGTISIDGNNAGSTTNSVASGTPLLNIATATLSLTGGSITIVDPSITGDYAVKYTAGSYYNAGAGHTFIFGDGTSTDAGAAAGFYLYSGTYFGFGSVTVNGANGGYGTNRFVTTLYQNVITGNLTVNAYGEWRTSSNSLYVAGNILVNANGILTTDATLYLSQYISGSASAVTANTQSIGGTGTYRNATSSATANFANLSIYNTNAGGVTFNTSASVLSGSNTGTVYGTFTLTAGLITSTAGSFTLGTSNINAGTLSYTAGAFNSGSSFARWFTTSTVTSGTAAGLFPFTNSSAAVRNVYFGSTSTITTGGEIAITYNDVAGTTSPTPFGDGGVTIANVSNSNWVVSEPSTMVLGTGTLSLGFRGDGLYTLPAGGFAAVRATGATAATGGGSATSAGGSGTVAAPQANKSGMSAAQIASTYYFSEPNYITSNAVTGAWESTSSWVGGVVPGCGSIVNIVSGANITVNATAGNCAALNNAGTLNVTGSSLTVGCTLNNSYLNNNSGGTLNVSAGTLNINGNLAIANGSYFTQTGGNINVDGNAAGVAANSVASGTPIVGIGTSTTPYATASGLTLSGGTLTIVDPHTATTNTNAYAFYYYSSTLSFNASGTHTLQFGNGTSTDAGGNSSGFYFEGNAQGSHRINFENITVNTNGGSNSNVTQATYTDALFGNFTITKGTYDENLLATVFGGNISVATGSTFIASGSPTFALPSGATTAAQTVAQSVSVAGTGAIVNNLATPTAHFAYILDYNSSSTGVTIGALNNITGAPTSCAIVQNQLTLGTTTPTPGYITASGTNGLLLGTAGSGPGTLTYNAGGVYPGSPFGYFFLSGNTGATAPTGGSDPTSAVGRYPLVSSAGVNRSVWLTRVTPSAAGVITATYNDATGTTSTSITDASPTYTVDTRTNANWVFSRAGTSEAATSYDIAAVGSGLFSTANAAAPRLVLASSVIGTYQGGTVTPGAQRITIPSASLVNTYYLGLNSGDLTYTAVANGDWTSGSTWSVGSAPGACATVIIPTGITVTVNAGNAACANLTINSGGTLTVSANTLTVGCTLNNNAFINNGTFNVTGGTVNINGYLAINSGANFSQSAGTINIDGNGGGVAGNSVPSTIPILGIGTSGTASTGTISLTGGTLVIVDPSYTTGYALFVNDAADIVASGTHTLQFGNGVSTDAGTSTNGFYINQWYGYGFTPQNVTINSLSTNGFVDMVYPLITAGNLTVTNGEFRDVSASSYNTTDYIAGNITVTSPGIFTNVNTTYLGYATYNSTSVTALATSTAQTIGGTGTFRNAVSGSTANFVALTVNNTYTTNPGVTLSSSLSASGTITLTAGVVATGSNMLSETGTTTGAVTRGAGWIYGALQWNMPTGSKTFTYPLGNNTDYMPAKLAFTTLAGSGTVTVRLNTGQEANMSTSPISATSDVNDYWTITTSGPTFASVIPTFTYNTADILSGTQTSFKIANYTSSWSAALGTTDAGANPYTSALSTGVTTIGGDFVVGIAPTPTITVAAAHNPGNTTVPLGSSSSSGGANNVYLNGFSLTSNVGTQSVTGITLTTTGSATTSDFGTFTLIRDVNQNGVYDAGDVVVGTPISTLSASLAFTGLTESITTAGTDYLLVANLPCTAGAGDALTVAVATTGVTSSTTIAGSTVTGGTMTAGSLPGAPGNPTSNSPQCSATGVTITESGSASGGNTWYWETSASGVSTGSNASSTENVNSSNTYYIRAQSALGCWSSSAGSVAVTVNPSPQGSFTGNTICAVTGAGALTWTASSTLANPYTIVYTNGSNVTVTANSGSPVAFATGTPAATTTYPLVSVTDNNGCSTTSGFTAGTATITVNPCSVNLTLASGTTFTSATYKPGLTSSLGGTNANLLGFSLSATGACSVSQLALILSGGSTDYSNFRIIRDVDNSGTWNTGDVTVGTVSTYGTTITFSGLTESINTTPVYYLLVADVPCSSTTGDAITATMPVAGISTTAVAGGTDQAGNAMTVGSFPATPSTPTSNSPQCVSSGVTITSAANGTADNWYWESSATGTSTSNAATSTENETTGGTYYVRAQNSNGCWSASSASIAVVVNPLPQGSFAGNTVCPSGNGMLTWTATTGTGPYSIVYTSSGSSVTASGEVSGTAFASLPATIASTSTFPLVTVTDANGCVRSTGFTAGTATITVNSLPAAPTVTPTAATGACGATINITGTSAGNTINWYTTATGGTALVTTITSGSSYAATLTAGGTNTFYAEAQNAAGCKSATRTATGVITDFPLYTVLPYTQTFEGTWTSNACSASTSGTDIADNYWKNSAIANTGTATANDYWHRDDYSGSDWSSTYGSYTPAGSNAGGASSSHSARFHNYDATSGSEGAYDLYINLSATGNKTLSFDYTNSEAVTGNNLKVLLSTDGGSTFPTTIATIANNQTSWVTKTYTLTATSATSVIRFLALSNYGGYDMGLDNINIKQQATITVAAANNPTAASYTIGSTSVSGGANNVILNGFSLTSTVASTSVTGLTLTTGGTAVAADYSNFMLIRDVNGNGVYDAGDVQVGSTITTLAASLSFTGLTESIGTTATDYLLVASVPCTGTAGHVITASIAATSAGVTSTGNTIAGTASTGNNMTVSGTLPATPGTPTSNSPQCVSTGVTITSATNATGNNWFWESAAGGTATTANASSTENETASGTYYVRAQTALGCWSTSAASVAVTVNPNPQGSLTIAPICSGGNGVLTWTASAGTGPYTVVYTNPSASSITASSVVSGTGFASNPTNPTNGQVFTLTSVTDANSCVTTSGFTGATATTVISSSPAAPTVTPTGATALCGGGTMVVTGTSAGNTINWYTTATGGTALVTGITSGSNYTATVPAGTTALYAESQSAGGCVSTTRTATGAITTYPLYTTLPYQQTFESAWTSNACSVSTSGTDIADNYWKNSAIANTGTATANDYWHRDDYSGSDWSSTYGSYTPAGSNAGGASSSHSARFHNYDATSGSEGAYDLYINLSATGNKTLSFDYTNSEAVTGNNLKVLLSTDGGSTFPTTIATIANNQTSWVTKTYTLTATSATSVIRFLALSNYGGYDMGLDNINIKQQATITVAAANNPTAASYTIGSTSVSGGANNVILNGFSLTSTVASTSVTGLTLTTGGTAVAADYSNFMLIRDVNGNGVYDAGDVQVGSTITTLAASLSFTGLTESIGTTATDYLLVASVPCTGTAGHVITASIAATSAGVTSTGNTIAGTASTGNNMTVSGTLPATPGTPTSNSPQCVSTGVTITSATNATGNNWFWESAASGTVTTANASSPENETASGTYYVRAQTALGCWSTSAASVAVTVNPLPQGAFSIAPVCSGTNANLTWTNSSTVANPYIIVYNNGSTNITASGETSGTGFTANPANPTNGEVFTVSSVTDNNGCVRTTGFTTASATATVNALPTITLSSISTVCAGSNASQAYTATTGSPNKYTITWNSAALTAGFTNVASTTIPASPISIPTPAAAAAGTYTGTLVVTNTTTTCPSAGYTINVTLNASPASPAAPTVVQGCYLRTGSITESGTAPGGVTWYWETTSTGTSTTLPATTPYAPSATGTYYISATNGTCWSPATSIAYTSGTGLAGTYNVGTGGDFTTLTDAVNWANNYGLCASTIFSLTNTGPTGYTDAASGGLETFPLSIYTLTGAGPSVTLTIQPATTATISANDGVFNLFDFEAASYVIINGSSGSGNSLTISDGYNGDYPVYYYGNCVGDVINNCNILGYSDNINASSVIYITGTATAGISILNNNIHDYSIGAGQTAYDGIYADNSGAALTITGNNIYNFADDGIVINGPASACVISNNSMYYTGTATASQIGISVLTGPSSGTGHTITGNGIGGNGSGGNWLNSVAGTHANPAFVQGIYYNVSGTANSIITGNTIQNITLTATNGNIYNYLRGIELDNGSATIGASGSGNGNVITGLSCGGTGAGTKGSFVAAGIFAVSSGVVNVNYNTISNILGNGTLPTGTYGFYSYADGILTSVQGSNCSISNNTIYNIKSPSYLSLDISSSAAAGANNYLAVSGIYHDYAATGITIANNTIYGLVSTAAQSATYYPSVIAISSDAAFTGGKIYGNKIYDLENNSTTSSTLPGIAGIRLYGGQGAIYNNQIILTNAPGGTPQTNNVRMYGISDLTGSGNEHVYNSVYIGGSTSTATGISSAWDMSKSSGANAFKVINNLLYNVRTNTGAGGGNYAITVMNGGTVPTAFTSNYNDLYSFGNTYNYLGAKGTTATISALGTWQTTAPAGDANSYAKQVIFSQTGPTTDLTPSSLTNCWLDGKGTPIVTPTYAVAVPTDYNTTTRNATTPDIGAIEFSNSVVTSLTLASGANSSTTSLTVCAGSTVSATAASNALATLTYAWTTPDAYVSTNPSFSRNVTSAMAGAYAVTVTDVIGCTTTATATLVVNPLPTATISGSTSVCYNSTSPNVTFTGASGTAPYTFTYNLNGGGNQTISTISGNSVSIAVPTTTATTYNYNLVSVQDASSTSCSQAQTGTATVVVYGNLTASISGGNNPICYNTDAGTLTATATGGTGTYTYQWYNSSGPIGLANSSTYAPGSLTASDVYSCSVTSGSCGTVSTGTTAISVDGNLHAVISGGNTPICYNSGAGTFTATAIGGTGTYTYQWYNNAGSIVSATSSVYAAGNLTASDVYYCSVTSGTCGTVATGNSPVTVYGNFTASISGGTTPSCYNVNPGNLTATATGATGIYTYQWYKTSGAIGGATSSTLNPGVLTVSETYSCSVTSGSCGTVSTGTAPIVVEPAVTSYGTVSASGGLTQTVCDHVAPNNGNPFVVNGAAGSSGLFTYQWYYQNALVAAPVGSSTSGWTACSSTDGTGYNTNGFTAAGTGNNITYACFVIPASPVCGLGQWAANDVQITVLTTGPIETSSGGANVCLSGSVSLSSSLSVVIPATYQWYSSTSPGFGSPTLITGATATTYSPPTSASGTLYYEVVASFSGSGCSPATSNAQTVVVYTTPTASQAGGTTPICYNSSPGTFTATGSGGSGSFTYQWYDNSGIISGATGSAYSPGNLTASDAFNCTVTDVAGCGVLSTTATSITVDGNLTAAISGGTTPICYNTSPGTFTATASGGTTVYTYQWYNGSGLIIGETASTYSPGVLTASNSYFCTVNSGTCGPVNTPIANITVRANLTAIISGGTTPICYNAAPGSIRVTASGGSGTYTYQWYNSSGSVAGATASSYAPGNLTASQSYHCVVTGGVCGSITTAIVTIVVDGNLTATVTGGTTPVCYNSAPGTLTVTGSGGTGSYTYQWYNSSSSIGGATASTYAPGNLTAGNSYRCSVTSGSCGTVASSTSAIAVNSALSATISGGSTPVCYNASPGSFTAAGTGGDGTYTYQWYNDAGSISGAIASTYAPGNLTASDGYYCQVTSGSCGIVYTSSTAVTVDAVTSVSASNTGPYVFGQTINLLSTSSGALSYQWSGPNGYSSGAQNPGITGATAAMAGTYTVVATNASGCEATASTDVVVTNGATYTWTGNTSTDWTIPTNWFPASPIGGPNACGVDVIIPSTSNNPVISTGVQVGNIQLSGNALLTLNAANISVCKDWVGGAGSVAAVTGSGVVVLNGSASQTITGNTQMQELMLSNSSGAAMQSGSVLDIYTALDLSTGNFDATNGNLTFKSNTVNNVGIIDNFSGGYTGTLTGSINAERYYATSLTFNQHFMGSPVNTPSLTQLAASGSAGFVDDPTCDELTLAPQSNYGNVFSLHESAGATCGMAQWKVEVTGSMQNGLGYSVLKPGNGTLVLNGTANLNSSYSISGLTNSNWSNQTLQHHTETSGWQLISNPYLATLNLTTTPAGFDNQVQIWNANGPYAGSYQPGSIGSDATIAPFQAFMVHKTAPGGTATFTMNARDRVRTAQTFFAQNANQLTIVAANTTTGLLDQTTVGFNLAATDTFDAAIDAVKIPGKLNRQTLYTVNNNKWMARNILNDEATTSTVPMGFEPGANGTFKLTFNGLNTFDPTSYIYLEDKTLHVMYNVRNGDYTFTADSADSWNRFVLHFTPAALITTTDANCTTSGTINIEQPGTANWNYTLTDSSNAIITSGTLNQSQQVTVGVPAGTYLLTLVDTNSYTVTKTIQVNGPEMVTAAFQASNTVVQTGQTVTLTSTSTGAASYQWNLGNGTTASTAVATASYTEPGVYTVSLLVTSPSGCTASKNESITVNANTTGLSNISGVANLKIWSHSNKVYVDFTGTQIVDATVIIYDILGREMSNENVKPGNLVIQQEFVNIDAEYLIVMVRNDNKITTKKVFITNTK